MRKVTLFCLVSSLVMGSVVQVLAQTQRQVTVAEIIGRPEVYVNTTVNLVGEIRNPQETEVARGTYQFCDASEACISVRTRMLPGSGEMVSLTGEVRVDPVTSQAYIYEMNRGAPGPTEPGVWTYLLIGGGVVLAGLIILLVVLLTKKTPGGGQVVVTPAEAHRGDTVEVQAPAAAQGGTETQEAGVAAAPLTREFYGVRMMVEEGPDAGKTFALSKPRTTIGRSPDRDIRLSDATVSRMHATIVVRDDGTVQLINESTKGTLVNGTSVDATALSDGDRIEMGSTILAISMAQQQAPVAGGAAPTQEFAGVAGAASAPSPDATQEFLGVQLEVTGGPHAGATFVLSKSATLIGRKDDQDIVLVNDKTVSREHCEIRHDSGAFILVTKPDKKVLVNGQEQITCQLSDGDELQLGSTKLRFMKI